MEYVINNASNAKFIYLGEAENEDESILINIDGRLANFSNELFQKDANDQLIVQETEGLECFTEEQLVRFFSFIKEDEQRARNEATAQTNPSQSYTSSRLTFYRDQIEPLDWSQTFSCMVNDDVYEMTKKEFYDEFDNVVQTKSYLEYGVYSYSRTPQKAEQFKRSR